MKPLFLPDGSVRSLTEEETLAAMGPAPAPLSDRQVERILAEPDPADRPDPDA